ncbi:amino acid adenylation domain-containing protein [Nocardia sp. CDC159]|uniref:Phenyloxazoline synthase MbtB n=1 Tax=Nocardia pulmonis TaxID=2951408 RepID=A0A9X2IY43_9NOCA|nr:MULTISPECIES: amino acid adenylation domain-containing protein [Nocardia]MCM6776033.1 amino acid adenylation domain-containing protein [Nocardia pulmonis]MCM6788640.1 amino acid adenylation domain-containing protein [Nocardia sp. CDC159]
MLGKADVRDIVAAELGMHPESIGYGDDLVSLGMHSMKLMRLAARWRKQGHEVRSSELALRPTIDDWAELLASGRVEPERPAAAPVAAAEADTDEFALATMQHAYWVGRRQDQRLGGVAAHLYVEFDGRGLVADRMRTAVRRLVRRHEQLRVRFTDSGTQRVLPEPLRPVFHVVDLTGESDSGAAELERLRQEKSHQRMDVEAGQVIDITLTLLPDGNHRLHVDVDMLAGDALSYRRILDDLAHLYETDADALAPVGYTFREYLSAKRRTAPDNSAAKSWWENRIRSLPDIPALPVLPEGERPDPARSIRLHHLFGPEAKARLHAVAHSHGITPAVALATVFSEVIARWSAQQRFLLNVPLFDREPLHDDIDRVVGDFTNSVLVDVDARRTESMVERAKRLQRELHTCAAHATYEGLDVLRDLGRLRGGPVTPSVVFTSGLDLGELFSERVTALFGAPVWILSQGPQVDLDAQVVELAGGLLVNWDVRRDAMPAGVVEAMFAEFRDLLLALVEPDADWHAALTIPLPRAQRAVRDAVNATAADLGARTLHDAFFDLAERDPERVALRWRDGGSSSYGELSEQALAVARALVEAGVRPGDTVAVIVAKGHRQIPAVLGVLAAGATYLPIGTGQPPARRDRILTRAAARVALVDEAAPDLPSEITAVSLRSAVSGPRLDRRPEVTPDALAYVLFTSGSTGEPKGVEVGHRAATNTIDAIAAHFALGRDDRLIGLSSLEFDLSVFDIFCPLALGGALVCVDAETERDAAAWAALIAETGVSVINCAPGLLGMLLDTASAEQLRSLRVVITGGDRVKTELAQRFRVAVPGLRFAGLGGTTETAIHSTVCEVTDDFPADRPTVPYGTPLANVALRVVNERGEDCPDWVIGELWIGGTSVADGYRGDAERTADRFVELDGVRWYRTGDLARYLPDGTVDFLGRADHQVKIRGYRVELGEVEAALTAQPGVREAVALVTDAGRLVAAVTVDGPAPELTSGLRDLLPAHMIPEAVEVLDAIPLTANGKLDRAAIRRMIDADALAERAYVAPANEVETAVAYIVAQILGVEAVGVETDFFDIGGNSILATTLTAKIRGLLAVRKFGVTEIFEGRTVRRICASLLAAEADPARLEQVSRILLELAEVPVPVGAAN